MRTLAFLVLAWTGAALAQTPDIAWPRISKAKDGTQISVYQPQLERWADNTLAGRSAIAVTRPGEKDPDYGVIELSARTAIDKASDVVTLSSVRINKASFPGSSQEQADAYLATLRAALPKDGWRVSAQALQANLAITTAQSKQKSQPVKNDPPQILFRKEATLLVMVDGEPQLREAKEAPGLQRVINTMALILQDKASSTFYLRAVAQWWESKAVAGTWTVAKTPPAALDKVRAAMEKQYDPIDGRTAEGKPIFEGGVTPKIVVATRPTELLQSRGEPQYTPIPGTKLLFMQNSRNDIFVDTEGQQTYALISGRWFRAKTLDGPWSYVPPKNLPADFARIPAAHQIADVLSSVPGTTQAREAAIANQIPQTATVQRDVKPEPVAFDGGKPEWKPVDGTPLSYAPNTAAPVIRVDDKTYYLVQNGVWFSATAPAGPYSVATTVPAVIYSIPPSSPLHYVTYVRIYSSTPSTVFVGYTPGYYGTVMTSDGVVVYGTGYYYPGWYGPYYWYPPPPTYGYAAGFTVGIFIGFAFGPPWHYGGCCWGGPPVVIHHHHGGNINNSYNKWGGKSTSITGPGGRNLKATQVGDTTFAKGSGSNNVYAGRDGNVYRRDESGDWQKHGGKGEGWQDLEKPQRPDQRPDRPQQQPSDRGRDSVSTRDRPQQSLPGETRQSLDRQHQSRQAGDMRAQQMRSGGGGFQGGGGMRGGGGGRGGRR